MGRHGACPCDRRAGLQAYAAKDDGFSAFWARFAAAVGKDDKAALAGMVTLSPALDDNDTPLTFDKFHAADLRPAARRCLAKAKPDRSDQGGGGAVLYSVLCGQVIYGFTKTGGVWRLTDLSPDD